MVSCFDNGVELVNILVCLSMLVDMNKYTQMNYNSGDDASKNLLLRGNDGIISSFFSMVFTQHDSTSDM